MLSGDSLTEQFYGLVFFVNCYGFCWVLLTRNYIRDASMGIRGGWNCMPAIPLGSVVGCHAKRWTT
jgi:hypothetical protein